MSNATTLAGLCAPGMDLPLGDAAQWVRDNSEIDKLVGGDVVPRMSAKLAADAINRGATGYRDAVRLYEDRLTEKEYRDRLESLHVQSLNSLLMGPEEGARVYDKAQSEMRLLKSPSDEILHYWPAKYEDETSGGEGQVASWYGPSVGGLTLVGCGIAAAGVLNPILAVGIPLIAAAGLSIPASTSRNAGEPPARKLVSPARSSRRRFFPEGGKWRLTNSVRKDGMRKMQEMFGEEYACSRVDHVGACLAMDALVESFGTTYPNRFAKYGSYPTRVVARISAVLAGRRDAEVPYVVSDSVSPVEGKATGSWWRSEADRVKGILERELPAADRKDAVRVALDILDQKSDEGMGFVASLQMVTMKRALYAAYLNC